MPSGGDAISAFAGPAGVGALCILAAFLFLDGRAPDLFPTVELYAKTATWGVVAAIPTLAVSYVIGLSVMIASERALIMLAGPTPSTEVADLARIGSTGSLNESAASQAYVEALHNRAILAGGAFSLLLLSAGALSDIRSLPGLRGVILIAAVATTLVAATASYLGIREGYRAHAISEAVANAPPTAGQ